MASHFSLFLTFLLVLLFISPSTSLTCSSQTFSSNTKFTNCTDLPSLKSFLHWTFDTTKHTLSIAFTASPASPDGWIAWGINPNAQAMVGTQSLIAFKNAKGSVIVNTYNLTSYKSITESKLLYNVLDSKAESSSDGVMTIFATLELPKNTKTVNQVWQVGPAVKDGMPVVHEFEADNLNSKTTLDLATSATSEGNKNNNVTASTSNSSSGQSGKETGGSSRMLKSETSVFAFLFFLGVVLLQL
ncbi:cytochrome b561 and DOMON domain-containing protein At3g25290 [Lycium barbarum]|uniref:cytochrome b561 and DOMON domain-containing protein At3g25290 n=1 Tax=Lycium barbarum TaxID=112863 RepID=UPI00293EC34B|nr:cytochrome b561 and DOMON domain-containing protein At3g25290 [Lycium barbarum]